MLHQSLKDIFIFSNFCWESTSTRIRYIALSLIKKHRLFYVEPPVLGMTGQPKLNESYSAEGLTVLTPYLPLSTEEKNKNDITHALLKVFIEQENITYYDSWYFSPGAWDYSHSLHPQSIIYNVEHEFELDTPLADEASYIFSSQQIDHDRCILIPDGVDFEHFSQARLSLIRPDDLADIPSPRIGCYSVYDQDLIEEVARRRPDLQFIFLMQEGSVELSNVHYLGMKNFFSLPLYFSHWDVALTSDRENQMMELLASGTPVICLNEREIDDGLIHQATNIDDVIFKIDLALQQNTIDPYWIDRVDSYLQSKSWDHQVELMLKGQRPAVDFPTTDSPALTQ